VGGLVEEGAGERLAHLLRAGQALRVLYRGVPDDALHQSREPAFVRDASLEKRARLERSWGFGDLGRGVVGEGSALVLLLPRITLLTLFMVLFQLRASRKFAASVAKYISL
jgi:hypothetical protein